MTAAFDGRSATEHAEAAAEAVRAINHITGWPAGHGLSYPSDAYAVVERLAALAAMLPQACMQIDRTLARWHAAEQIGIDRGTKWAGDPAGAVLAARAGLACAGVAAQQLYAALHEAAEAVAYGHYTGAEPDDGVSGVGA
jgi:hypothetical protein